MSWLVVFKRLNLWRDEIKFRILLIVKHFNQTNGTKHLIEKIKSLMSTSIDNLQLTVEQEVIRAVEYGTEISHQHSGDDSISDSSLEHKL